MVGSRRPRTRGVVSGRGVGPALIPFRDLHVRLAAIWGFEGAEPLASPFVPTRGSLLSHNRVAQASPVEPPKTPLRAPPGTALTGPSQTGSLPSCSPAHGRRRRRADSVTSLAMAALSADRRFSPYPLPLGNPQIVRSWAILRRPVGYPKHLRAAPKRATEPVAGSGTAAATTRAVMGIISHLASAMRPSSRRWSSRDRNSPTAARAWWPPRYTTHRLVRSRACRPNGKPP